MIKSFKYRIYLTPRQERKLLQTLTTCRFLYNDALSERITKYKENKESVSYIQQANSLKQHKNKYQQKDIEICTCGLLYDLSWDTNKAHELYSHYWEEKGRHEAAIERLKFAGDKVNE